MERRKPIFNIISLSLLILAFVLIIDEDRTEFFSIPWELQIKGILLILGFFSGIISIKIKEKLEPLAWAVLFLNGFGSFNFLFILLVRS